MTATLTLDIDSYEGTGKVFSDAIGREMPSVALSAVPVRCEE